MNLIKDIVFLFMNFKPKNFFKWITSVHRISFISITETTSLPFSNKALKYSSLFSAFSLAFKRSSLDTLISSSEDFNYSFTARYSLFCCLIICSAFLRSVISLNATTLILLSFSSTPIVRASISSGIIVPSFFIPSISYGLA